MSESEIIEALGEGRASAVRALLDKPFEAGVRALVASNAVMAWISEQEDIWDNRDIEWCDAGWYADFLADRSRLELLFDRYEEVLAEDGWSRLIMDRFDELVRTGMDHAIPAKLPVPDGTPPSHWWYFERVEMPELRAPDPLDQGEVAAAFARVLAPGSYLERRPRQAAAMRAMPEVGRACARGSLDSRAVTAALSSALCEEDQLTGWLVRAELETRYRTWPMEDLLELRTGLQFLIELRPGWPDGESLTDFAEIWDDEIAQRSEPRRQAPPDTPADHRWWRR